VSLRSAATALSEAIRLQPAEERRVVLGLAELRLLELEAASSEAAARSQLDTAVALARRIEELAGDEGSALLAASRLRRWESKLSGDEARRVEAGREAAALLDRALAINPALESELEEELERERSASENQTAPG